MPEPLEVLVEQHDGARASRATRAPPRAGPQRSARTWRAHAAVCGPGSARTTQIQRQRVEVGALAPPRNAWRRASSVSTAGCGHAGGGGRGDAVALQHVLGQAHRLIEHAERHLKASRHRLALVRVQAFVSPRRRGRGRRRGRRSS